MLDVQHPDLLSINQSNFSIAGDLKEWVIHVKGLSAGHSIISTNVTPSDIIK